jgi:Gpi18-like mannosyltransferase
VSVLFDLLLAFFVYRIVALRQLPAWQPILAGAVVLLLPTVVTNSGWWGQADSIYAAFAVGGIYFVLQHRPWWACAFFGIALALKLQTVFIFPFLSVLVLTRRLPWRALLAIPLVYLALDVPALLVGADPGQLLTIYARQTDTYQDLALNAPSVYQFVSAGNAADAIRTAGVLFTGAVVIALTAMIVLRRTGQGWLRIGWRRPELTATRIVLLATTTVILVPFLLPAMHERYFYLADVLSVVAAFYLPHRLWYLPILVQVASFRTYLRYLSRQGDMGDAGGGPWTFVPSPGAVGSSTRTSRELKVLAMLIAAALLVVLWATFREFRRTSTVTAPALTSVPPEAP